MASGTATVKEVITGDTLVLVGAPKGGPPPEKRVSLSSVIAPRVAIKSLTHESPDEPYGWPSREFMRERLIGQQVTFNVEYVLNGKEFACVKFQNENVACELLKRGLAKLRDNKNPPAAHDLEELERCESEAKSKQLGLFSSDAGATTVRQITWGVGDSAFVSGFANEHKGKVLPSVVEYVRDGGSLRVAMRLSKEGEMPASYAYCSLSLAGIQCPGTKRDADGKTVPEPYAAEARFFVEIRLLNRSVGIQIQGCDSFGNLLGSVIHPKGDISVLLLANGFAKINNATASLTDKAPQFRQAMKEAQTNRLRRWKDVAAPAASNEGLSKVYFAVVEEVVSGDCVILRLSNGDTRRVYFASIRCLRPSGPNKTQSREDEAIALEAKELVRKKSIGKTVKVFLEYIRPPFTPPSGVAAPPASDSSGNMHFVSIYVGSPKLLGLPPPDADTADTAAAAAAAATPERKGQNITELLLQAGLAKTVPHRAEDEQAERFDVYQQLEEEAKAAKKGGFAAPNDIKVVRMVDLVGPANTQRAIAHLQQLQRHPHVEAIVENIFNAARFKLRIPSQNLMLSFVLAGIRSPQTGRPAMGTAKAREAEPFSVEALQFARERIQQREVQITVEQCDRGGSFIGSLFYGPKKSNLAVELLQQGLAQTVPLSVSRATFKTQLLAAEEEAKKDRRNLWGLPGAVEDETPQDADVQQTLLGVVVSHVEAFDLFYIQAEESRDKLSHIAGEIADYLQKSHALDSTYTPAGLPRKGEIVLGLHAKNKEWLRARVTGREGSHIGVLYVDYGGRDSLPIESIRRCPAALATHAIPPQAIPCALAGMLPPPEMEHEAAAALRDLVRNRTFHCLVETLDEEKRRRCILTEEEEYADKGLSINSKMLRAGLGLADRKSSSPHLSRFISDEQVARKQHLNVWRYGDIGVDDEEEDYDGRYQQKRGPGRR